MMGIRLSIQGNEFAMQTKKRIRRNESMEGSKRFSAKFLRRTRQSSSLRIRESRLLPKLFGQDGDLSLEKLVLQLLMPIDPSSKSGNDKTETLTLSWILPGTGSWCQDGETFDANDASFAGISIRSSGEPAQF